MGVIPEIVFDLETQRLSYEVEGGWNNIHGFGLALAVTWDGANGFRKWLEGNVNDLVAELARYEKIVGFNLLRFDYEVLAAYEPSIHDLLDGKTFDILADLEARLGFRVSLESVCLATLGKGKSGSGEDAVRWFREGQIDKVSLYCQRDVELTREIYRHGQEHGFIHYSRYGELVRIDVNW